MQTILYILWFGVPAGYSLVTLWAFLESLGEGKSNRKRETSGLLKQALFLWIMGFTTLFLDRTFVSSQPNALVPELLGNDSAVLVFRLLLFPVLVVVAAMLMGGSAPIKLNRERKMEHKKLGAKAGDNARRRNR
jgi:hypothetical protein